ncbi:unnamed protein product [Orchesella dallaii]|uniref:Uncharacterized protein n=1 Tax=Orchesella dallaii TaxID=48710 RepID=A0ABP1R8N5_9HEXA
MLQDALQAKQTTPSVRNIIRKQQRQSAKFNSSLTAAFEKVILTQIKTQNGSDPPECPTSSELTLKKGSTLGERFYLKYVCTHVLKVVQHDSSTPVVRDAEGYFTDHNNEPPEQLSQENCGLRKATASKPKKHGNLLARLKKKLRIGSKQKLSQTEPEPSSQNVPHIEESCIIDTLK